MGNANTAFKFGSLISVPRRWLQRMKVLQIIFPGAHTSATQIFNYKVTSNKAECQRAAATTLASQFHCGPALSKNLPCRSFLIK